MSLREWFTKSDRVEPLELVLYTRRTCPLCDEMKHEIERAGLAQPYTLRVVDIDSDAQLTQLHGRSIPVLAIDGHIAFKGRLTARDLLRKVEYLRREKRRA